MRVVADTNVIVSAFLWGGTPRRLLAAAEKRKLELFTSRALITELEDVLLRAKFAERLRKTRFTPAFLPCEMPIPSGRHTQEAFRRRDNRDSPVAAEHLQVVVPGNDQVGSCRQRTCQDRLIVTVAQIRRVRIGRRGIARLPQNEAKYLNTPRLVADATGTTVWRWDQQEPFGNNPADEDPDANSVAFDLPLRLPGQRYDAETALHYNYFRDYDPSLGIYKESDLIGLRGGLNTYAYGYSNPLRFFDPEGKSVVLGGVALVGLGLVGGAIYIQQHGGKDGKKSGGSVWDDIGGGTGGSVWDDVGGGKGASDASGSSDTSKGRPPLQECLDECMNEYWTNIAMCTVARAFWGLGGAARCYENAMNIRVECEKKCRRECR